MSGSQRRQMMQPWPLCLAPFAKTKERSVLPKYYTRVSPVIRPSPSSSGSTLDCSSSTTLETNVSPFNSQTALIAEKKHFSGDASKTSNHYYAENLRNNHQKALNGAQIYKSLNKRQDDDYKQLDPLLPSEQSSSVKILIMDSQNVKLPLDGKGSIQAPCSEFQKISKPSPMRYLKQVLAALTVSLCSLVVGYASSYTSPALVSMRDNSTTPFEVTKQMGMWIGSLMPLTALFGGIAGGPCIEYFGRKTTILATSIPFIAGWLLIGLAQNVPMILVGRMLCGFGVGIASLTLPVYLGETIQTEVRGSLGLMPTVFGNTGILLCFTGGMYFNWRHLALLGAILSIPSVLLMFAIPETPRWYISKNKTKQARNALQWLRSKDVDISEELMEIEKSHIESERSANQGAIRELFKRNHLKPLLISLGLMLFQQLSGINAVIFYTVQIFQDAGSTIDENISTIIIGIVNFVSTFMAAFVIDRLGRKMLLYVSSVSMAITLFALGAFFYVKSMGIDVTFMGWLPLFSLIVYVIGFSLGFGPIPWLMMGEILPARIRGLAASIATGFNWTSCFVVTKTFQDIISLIGAHGAFWLFGLIVVTGFVFVIISVPETRGRSLEEIEKRFTGPTRRMSAVANMKPMPMAC